MYKILVVDDEPRHRKGLANMIKELRPAYEIFELEDGKEALDFISSNSVNIVVTDIKMPIMDGLELIQGLKDGISSIKFIIISGYSNFEYAQKAVSLGAFDYILKPVNKCKILEMLEKVEKSIGYDIFQINEKESLKEQLNNTLPVYFEHQMNKLLTGYLSQPELEEIDNVLKFKGAGLVIVASISKFKYLSNIYSNEKINEIQFHIKHRINEVLNSLGQSISFFFESDKGIMVTIIHANGRRSLICDEILTRLNEFIYDLKTTYGIDVTVGLGGEYENIFEEVRNSFQEARTAVSYSFFLGIGRTISYKNINCNFNSQLPDFYKVEEELANAIRHHEVENAVKLINSTLEKSFAGGFPHPRQFIKTTIYAVLSLMKNFQNVIREEQYNKLILIIENQLNECEEYIELKHKVNELLFEIINIIKQTKHNKNEIIIKKCLHYIDEHYMEDLSLESVAEMFYFNSNYFSGFFKNHTGTTLSEYLLKVRMKNARYLLGNTNYKVYEIAARVGYKDDKYFNKIFKKEFAIAPDEFRRGSINKIK